MGMLAVQVDDVRRRLGQRRHRGETTVEVGPRPPVGGDDPREHDLFSVDRDETPVDPGFGSPVAHHRGIGPSTDEQLDRLDQHRLARPGLAGDCRETRAEHDLDALDHTEVLDVEFRQHRLSTLITGRPGRTWP